MIKPIIEKYKSCNEVEVLVIKDFEFALRKIDIKQAEFLNQYYEYFINNPLEFIPFLEDIVIDHNSLYRFLNIKKDDYKNINIDSLYALIKAICIDSLSLRPRSLDYTLSNIVKDLIDNNNILQRFISRLLMFGYKKSEIDEFSTNKIIRLALEESFIRDKCECIIFISSFINLIEKEKLPLSHKALELVYDFSNSLIFPNEKQRIDFLNKLEETKGRNARKEQKTLKPKSIEEIKKIIKNEHDMLDSIPD